MHYERINEKEVLNYYAEEIEKYRDGVELYPIEEKVAGPVIHELPGNKYLINFSSKLMEAINDIYNTIGRDNPEAKEEIEEIIAAHFEDYKTMLKLKYKE